MELIPLLLLERETGLKPANLLLGKQTLYQLSYSRIVVEWEVFSLIWTVTSVLQFKLTRHF
jgi:hypothetical protein